MKNFISRFLDKTFSKTSFTVTGGRKFKDDSIYCFHTDKKKWGVMKINEAGNYETLLPPIYDSTEYQASHDLIVAVNYTNGEYTVGRNSYFIFTTDGLEVASFENIDRIFFSETGTVFLVKNKKYGTLDEYFQIAIPCEYASLTSLSKNIFSFEKVDLDNPNDKEDYDNSTGIITDANEILISFEFTFRVFPYVYLDTVIIGTDHRFLIDREYFSYNIQSKEKKRLPFDKIIDTENSGYHFNSQPYYRTIAAINYATTFPFDITSTSMEEYEIGKWGVILPNGEIVIPEKYDYIERIAATYFKFGIGIPEIEENAEGDILYLKNIKWGVIDCNNKIILEPEFEWISFHEEQNIFITNKGGLPSWNTRLHKPEWEILGGTDEEFSVKSGD